ncbi:hypothetical protein DFH08DRAFT_940957 [Mycena albidolilacea]|uniref:Uncharacterized protein n=1 Tax=Mycena albidolilacea TaxID=1033008 RepID=A0AAD6ZKD1_9AGAR|nr:hypothetical protein DFH08DRAFT_940957 [Mycena albidolilacea]
MQEQLTSQIISLLSLILIPFIPNSTLRYIAVVLASISLAAYLVYHNAPTHQASRLDAAAKEVNTLFEVATAECIRDPRFVYEAGLKLTEYDPRICTGVLADHIQTKLRGVDSAFTNPQHEGHRVVHRRMSARTGRVAFVGLACARMRAPAEVSGGHRSEDGDSGQRIFGRKDRIQPAAPLPDQPPDERPSVFEVCSGKPPTASTDEYPQCMSFRTGSVPYGWDLDQSMDFSV